MTSHAGLPTQLTSFVGRRQEVVEVRRVLQRSRLVTITGIAGVGKTRVAMRAAQLTQRAFADGVVFVELSGVADGAALEEALVHALEISGPSSSSARELLLGHLGGRSLLLVLDTCEHLVEECSGLIQALLPLAPGLHVLVTSRQALRAPGEHTVIIRPMTLPGATAAPSELERIESVSLFLDRATAADQTFELTEGNAEAVAELCRRLEGIPLAIELAAVRVRAAPSERLLQLMDEQASAMVAAIAWSHELCTARERLLWERLTVFSGTFDLAAAEEVCADDPLPGHEVFTALDGLVEKSIIIRERDPGHTVYRMLDGIREFAEARLGEEEAHRLRLRHRAYYHALALRLGADHAYPSRVEEWVLLRADWPNLRAALEFTDQVEETLEMVLRLWFLWVFSGMAGQGRGYLERLLATGRGDRALRIGAQLLLTHVCVGQGDLAAARRAVETAEASADGLDALRPYVANMWGTYLFAAGELEAAERHLTGAMAALEPVGDVGWCNAVTVLGFTHVAQGRLDTAIQVLTSARVHCRERGEDAIGAWAELGLAMAMRLRGDLGQARRMARSALRDIAPLHANFAVAFCVEVLGWLAADTGKHAHAARLLAASHSRWAIEVSPLFGSPLFLQERARYDRRLRHALGSRYDKAVATGRAMSAEEVIAYALAAGRGAPQPDAPPVLEPLTRRETDVAELVADGLTNRAIAQKLVVSRRTVDTHLENILSKLGFSGRSQIAAWVIRQRRA